MDGGLSSIAVIYHLSTHKEAEASSRGKLESLWGLSGERLDPNNETKV
jgi:hypothetical protein